MAISFMNERTGDLRYKKSAIAPGAQTKRPGDAAPVSACLQVRAHRPIVVSASAALHFLVAGMSLASCPASIVPVPSARDVAGRSVMAVKASLVPIRGAIQRHRDVT